MPKSTLPEVTSDMQVVETYDPGTVYNRFFNHTRFNRLDGDGQREYEASIWQQALKRFYRLRNSKGSFWELSKKEAGELVEKGLPLVVENRPLAGFLREAAIKAVGLPAVLKSEFPPR